MHFWALIYVGHKCLVIRFQCNLFLIIPRHLSRLCFVTNMDPCQIGMLHLCIRSGVLGHPRTIRLTCNCQWLVVSERLNIDTHHPCDHWSMSSLCIVHTIMHEVFGSKWLKCEFERYSINFLKFS